MSMSTTRVHSQTAALAVLLTAPFMAQADATIANIATPSIRTGLGAAPAAVELVIGGYLVAFAVRIRLNFDADRRSRAIARYAAALSAGAVSGQVLGGVLIGSGLGWRSVFLVTVPVCVVVLVTGPRLLPADERTGTATLDLPGVGTLAAALMLLIVPLTLGRDEGRPMWTWISLAAVIPATLAFLSTQRRAARSGRTPLVRLEVLARPAIAWALVALFVATGTYYALLFTLAQYFQTALGRGALASGLIMVPWVAAFGLSGQVTRRLADRSALWLSTWDTCCSPRRTPSWPGWCSPTKPRPLCWRSYWRSAG